MHTFLSPPKEKCERPIGLQALPSRRSRRVRPPQGNRSAERAGGFPLAPSPLRFASRSNRAPHEDYKPFSSRRSRRVNLHRGQGFAPAGAPKGFPRGKQSARFALPCAPLVVCLNSGSLTAFGGCIHWIPASLRSPLHPFGSPTEAIKRPIGLQALPLPPPFQFSFSFPSILFFTVM